MTREEILDLAQFARQLVRASVVEPPIGDGPGKITLEEVPLEDRAFIFEWACRALGQKEGVGNSKSGVESRESGVGQKTSSSATPHTRLPTPESLTDGQEELSSAKLERFRQE
jgi:hypothetical protein